MGRDDYTPQQVTRALRELVAHGGDCEHAAEELLDDEFQVPVATLRRWRHEDHAEQYRRLEEEYGRELERQAVNLSQRNVARAAQIEANLLEEMEGLPREQKAQALRAVADSKSKGIDKVLALTGRNVPPPQGNNFADLLRSLQAQGVLKVNVSLEAGQGDGPKQIEPAVDGTAEETP